MYLPSDTSTSTVWLFLTSSAGAAAVVVTTAAMLTESQDVYTLLLAVGIRWTTDTNKNRQAKVDRVEGEENKEGGGGDKR